MKCPECGEELGYKDKIYTGNNTDCILGCSLCIDEHNAVEWEYDHPNETFKYIMEVVG